jgi:hypothetical protein
VIFYRARSAITGRWVKMWWAITHPKQAVIEKVRKP